MTLGILETAKLLQKIQPKPKSRKLKNLWKPKNQQQNR